MIQITAKFQFTGASSFLFPLDQIEKCTNKLAGTKLKISASVTDWHLLHTREAVSYTHIYSSEMKYKFVGGLVRTFKPGAVFPVYVSPNS